MAYSDQVSGHDHLRGKVSPGGEPSSIESLVDVYLDEMDNHINKLKHAFAEDDEEILRTLVHQLKGSAGCYGFQKITDAAAALEKELCLAQEADLCRVSEKVEDLLRACRSIDRSNEERLPSGDSIQDE